MQSINYYSLKPNFLQRYGQICSSLEGGDKGLYWPKGLIYCVYQMSKQQRQF